MGAMLDLVWIYGLGFPASGACIHCMRHVRMRDWARELCVTWSTCEFLIPVKHATPNLLGPGWSRVWESKCTAISVCMAWVP